MALFRFTILSLFFFLIGSAFPLLAQNADKESSYSTVIDSLRTELNKYTPEEIISVFNEVQNTLYMLNDMDALFDFNSILEQAAIQAGDDRALALAYGHRVAISANYKLPDSVVVAEGYRALEVMRRVPEIEGHYFYTTVIMADAFIESGKYEDALAIAETFYAEAVEIDNEIGIAGSLSSMGKAYNGLQLYEKAEASFLEVLDKTDERKGTSIKCDAYWMLIRLLNKQGRYDDALRMCKSFQELLDRRVAITGNENEVDGFRFTSDLAYARVYAHTGDYAASARHIAQAETRSPYGTDYGVYMLEEVRYELMLNQEYYAEAQKSLDRIEQVLGDKAGYIERLFLREWRSELYQKWGLYDKAADNYKGYILLKDSVQRVQMAETLNSLRTRYEVDKLEAEKYYQSRIFRSTVTWLGVVLVLLCAIIAVITLDRKRIKAKNRSLLARIKEQEDLEKNYDLLRSELARQDITSSPDSGGPDKLGELFLRLKELMKDPVVFTDPDLSRKTIAERLGTNEKYVFDTIHRYYDMSIQAYLTHLRLNYAKSLLALPRENLTIEGVAHDAGFKNRATFHRLFKERYGMTPDEFRRLVSGS